MKKLIAFSGSNSSKSINQQLINIVAGYTKQAEVEVLSLKDYTAPIYGIDEEEENGIPEGIMRLKSKIDNADGLIISSPEHNGSIPSVLKNTVDWLSRAGEKIFGNKSMLLLSTSPGPRGGLTNLEHLTKLAPWWGANLVSTHSIGSFYDKTVNGELIPQEKEIVEAKVAELESAL